MKKLIITTLITLLFCTGLYARLGETLEELKERYGDPVEHHRNILRYKLHNFTITAWVGKRNDERVSVVMMYEKKSEYGMNKKIHEHEIEKLLDANFGKDKWSEAKQDEITAHNMTNREYHSGSNIANHDTAKQTLFIADEQYISKIQKESTKKMDDF